MCELVTYVTVRTVSIIKVSMITNQKLFLPDNCRTYNMNDNPKNNILLSENIRQRRLTILECFDKYMHRNIPELLVFFT